MTRVILIYGDIGAGKTSACLYVAKKAMVEGIRVGGVISTRVYENGILIGYDGYEPSSGGVFPIARLVPCPGWFQYENLKYVFSSSGFQHANEILNSSTNLLNRPSIVFVDEVGRLEMSQLGFYPGISQVAMASKSGEGIAIFTCRTNLVESVKKLLFYKANHLSNFKSCDVVGLWCEVKKYIGSPKTSKSVRLEQRNESACGITDKFTESPCRNP